MLFNSKSVGYIYILLPNLNSDDVIISRVKGGALKPQKFNRSNISLHGPDAQALIWKLHAAEVQPSARYGNTVRTRLYSGKNFKQIWKADRTVVRPNAFSYRPDAA
jgi:hypothetical protein